MRFDGQAFAVEGVVGSAGQLGLGTVGCVAAEGGEESSGWARKDARGGEAAVR